MDRKDFISSLGFGMAALCGAGCLAACSKDKDPAQSSGGTTNPPPVGTPGPLATVNLNTELINVNDAVVKNGVIIVRLAQGSAISSFTAVQVACTHQGTAINFNPGLGNFVCPNHGSQFTINGEVLNGPAAANLKKYMISISSSTLTVTS